MFINKKEKFSIRKFKDGRSDSVKIGTVGLIVGAALAMAAGTQTVEAAMTENSDNTTTISNDKGSIKVEQLILRIQIMVRTSILIQLKMEQIQSLKQEK